MTAAVGAAGGGRLRSDGARGARVRRRRRTRPMELRRLRPAATFPARRDDVRLLVVDPAAGRVTESRASAGCPSCCGRATWWWSTTPPPCPPRCAGRDDEGQPTRAATGAAPRRRQLLGGAVRGGRLARAHRAPAAAARACRSAPGCTSPGCGRRWWRARALSGRLCEVRFDREGDALVGGPVPDRPAGAVRPPGARAAALVGAERVRRPALGLRDAVGGAAAELADPARPAPRGASRLARLTHAAGLSATGDPDLDARLPLPERYEIPPETVAAVERARRRGGRVVAVGTTVVRALEGRPRSPRSARHPARRARRDRPAHRPRARPARGAGSALGPARPGREPLPAPARLRRRAPSSAAPTPTPSSAASLPRARRCAADPGASRELHRCGLRPQTSRRSHPQAYWRSGGIGSQGSVRPGRSGEHQGV